MEPVVNTSVKITDEVSLGGTSSMLLIAGPCVIESRDRCLDIGRSNRNDPHQL